MNRKKLLLLYCFSIIFICSCNSKLEESVGKLASDKLKSYIKPLNLNPTNYNYILIVPEDTCPDCLNKIKKFIESEKYEKVLFILVGGKKNLRLNLGEALMNLKSVYVFNTLKYERKYFDTEPILYKMNDDVIESCDTVYPDNVSEFLSVMKSI